MESQLLDKMFPPLQFNSSSVEEVLRTSEKKVILVIKSEKNKKRYDTFNNDFALFLSKLPEGPVKKFVSEIFNRNLVYFGASKTNDAGSFVRTFSTESNKFAGLALNSEILEIDLKSGEIGAVDDCVYAAYFGFAKSSILLNPKDVKKDKELHKLITTFLFLMYLKLLGKSMIVSLKQKVFLQVLCIYMYYKHFFKEKHQYVLSIIRRDYVGEIIPEDIYNEIEPRLEQIQSYDSMKDLPKLIYELRIASINQPQFIMQMLKNLRQQGFYSIMGPLDLLVASIITAQYPTTLFSKFYLTNLELHKEIETIVNKYMKKVEFAIDVLPK